MVIPVTQEKSKIRGRDFDQYLAIAFYSQMILIRRVEEQLLNLYAQGLLFGTVHTSMGQEACDVGIVNALDRERDVIFSNHRAHGQFIAYCDDVEGLIAEIMGKPSGVCGGIGGTQHLHRDNLYTNGIQGGVVPNAVGAALAEKLAGSGAITVVFLGDGTMGEGVVYESLNMASLWSLPILFVLEDNGIAQTTPKSLAHAGDFSRRAESFGIQSTTITADDVFNMYALAVNVIDQVRTSQRPFFIHAHTLRLGPHSKGDDTRSAEELEELRRRDPLRAIAGQLSGETRESIDAKTEQRIAKAVRLAIESGRS